VTLLNNDLRNEVECAKSNKSLIAEQSRKLQSELREVRL